MLGLFELILMLTALSTGLYYYLTKSFDHWISRGVKGPKPVMFYGTVKDLITNKCSMGDYLTGVYKKWKREPYVGIYVRQSPVLVLTDLDVIKDVLVKDFNKFCNRGTSLYENIEPLSPHLFNLEQKRWRPWRLKLIAVFTSGKLKEMFYLLVECVENFDKYFNDAISKTGTDETIVEVREISAKFTTDVIGVCAFGLQMSALASEDSLFRIMGRRIFSMDWKRTVQFRLKTLAPKLYKIVGHFLTDHEMNDFFIGTMRQTMDYRKTNGIVKHDFIDLLMTIRDHPDKLPEIELTDSQLAAQLFLFFIAGFETSSSTMSNAFYELALNRDIQDNLRNEIRNEMSRTNGIIEYEGIKNMKYLDMVLQETLRKYPPVTVIMRKSTEAYTFRGSSKDKSLTIEKDQRVYIPIYAIQRDPDYYPKPDIFDPKRFMKEAVKSRHPMTHLPFGDGPRNCIGKRFGVMQAKVGIVKILNNYRLEVCDKTQPYVNDPGTFFLTPINGIYLKVSKISCESAPF